SSGLKSNFSYLNLDIDTLNNLNFTSKRYSKLLNLFNFHSWEPAYFDVNNYNIKPGLSAVSQNLLSTTIATLGYYYNINEQHGHYYADLTYEGFYPVLDFNIDDGLRTGYAGNYKYNYRETLLETDAYLPLNFTTGKYTQFIQPFIAYNYRF